MDSVVTGQGAGGAGERPRLLDLFSGAGGAGMGYFRAGFDVTGVDIKPMPRYPFTFVQADALEYLAEHGHEFDAIHASPPCQGYSRMLYVTGGTEKPKLIAETRLVLDYIGRPYVIENVELAKPDMRNWVTLCGTMLGLRVRRHRLFETSPFLPLLVPSCHCKNGVRDGGLIGHRLSGPKPPGRKVPPVFTERELRTAMGVEWMSMAEMREAIPPAYCEYIGRQLMTLMGPEARRASA
jgi:DNA (cytosine-5)-methyltransferase 1